MANVVEEIKAMSWWISVPFLWIWIYRKRNEFQSSSGKSKTRTCSSAESLLLKRAFPITDRALKIVSRELSSKLQKVLDFSMR